MLQTSLFSIRRGLETCHLALAVLGYLLAVSPPDRLGSLIQCKSCPMVLHPALPRVDRLFYFIALNPEAAHEHLLPKHHRNDDTATGLCDDCSHLHLCAGLSKSFRCADCACY